MQCCDTGITLFYKLPITGSGAGKGDVSIVESLENSSLKILIIDDESIVHRTLTPYLEQCGHQVDSASEGESGLEKIKQSGYDVALLDIRMPGMDGLSVLEKAVESDPELSVVILSGHGNMEMAIQALRLGAADFLTKPVKLMDLETTVRKAARLGRLRRETRRLLETIGGMQAIEDQRERGGRMVAESPAMIRVKEQIKMAVQGHCDTLLVSGETGSGKEVVAREIHFMGGDKKPFIAVSCPALPDTLVESELFGHVKGSFTGSTADKAGCFEMAHGGTLFLDEIADLSQPAQAKLLRVLETRSVRRVGGSQENPVDVRVIASTNHPLERLVEERKFRQDLFYRLNLFKIDIPSLRERREDIMPLAKHFLGAYTNGRGLMVTGFDKDAEKALLSYDFPGNARELKNMVERAAMLCGQGEIKPEHLNLPWKKSGKKPRQKTSGNKEKDRIVHALDSCKWNRRQAARKLDIPYSTLRYKIKKYDLC